MWKSIVSVPDHCLCIYFQHLFESRVALNPGLGGVRDVASAIFSPKQTQ